MKAKDQPTKKSPGRPIKNVMPPIPRSPEQIAKAIFNANDKKLPSRD